MTPEGESLGAIELGTIRSPIACTGLPGAYDLEDLTPMVEHEHTVVTGVADGD